MNRHASAILTLLMISLAAGCGQDEAEAVPWEVVDERRIALEQMECERETLGDATPMSHEEFANFYGLHRACFNAAFDTYGPQAAETEGRQWAWQHQGAQLPPGDGVRLPLDPPMAQNTGNTREIERTCAPLAADLARIAATPNLCAPASDASLIDTRPRELIGLGRAAVFLSRNAWSAGRLDEALVIAENAVAALRDARQGPATLIDLSASLVAETVIVQHLQTMWAGDFELDAADWAKHRRSFESLANARTRPGSVFDYDTVATIQWMRDGSLPNDEGRSLALVQDYLPEVVVSHCEAGASAEECLASWTPHVSASEGTPERVAFDEMMSEHLQSLRNYLERAAFGDRRWAAAQALLERVAARRPEVLGNASPVLIPVGPVPEGRLETQLSLQFFPAPLDAAWTTRESYSGGAEH